MIKGRAKSKTYGGWGLSIIDRYLIKEFMFPFMLGVGGFTIIGIVEILFYLVDLAILSGASFYIIFKLLFYKLPGIMVIFFPMSALFSTMLLFIRMAKDNELSVLRTSGVNAFRIIYPVLILGFLVSIASFFVNESVVPISNKAADNLIKRELRRTPPPSISANTVFKDADRFFYIKHIDENKMKTVMVIENTIHFPRVILAKEGEWKNFRWTLTDGLIQEFDKEGALKYVDKFDELSINVNQNIRSFYGKSKKASEMDSTELREKIDRLENSGLKTTALQVEYYLKYSIPATCFVFVLIGVAYCFSFVKTGKDWWGVIFSICVSVLTVGLYFFLLALFRALAKDGQLDPFVGAWMANILYFITGSSMVFYQCKYR